ncbi:autotransporter outer membrane beta-barrel domain-containing protein [Mixta intestinalis]|uniref:Outer membrane protein IcsA autotransporter n=1 Tax=Mixta intestinalis TaxID=1615494 RepID=A0A6P1Q5E9_9GAMM|nr:autotransporter outer membrane beta-barrel domain-containing protein [Mixta intestinalis]QHM73158.1 Outer membrane protein IcsA autotransporter [Mixta intestinalis]
MNSKKYLGFLPIAGIGMGKTCLLISLLPFSVNGASPWKEESGGIMDVTSGYTSTEQGDYPLYVSGTGSELIVNGDYEFHANSAKSGAAKVENNGKLTIDGATLVNDSSVDPNTSTVAVVDVNSGQLDMKNSTVSTNAATGYGIKATGNSVIDVKDSEITIDGNATEAINVSDSSQLTADGLTINVNSDGAHGIVVASKDASVEIRNSSINFNNSYMVAAIEQKAGSLLVDNLTVKNTGEVNGIVISGKDEIKESSISNSNISVEKGQAISVREATLTLNNVHASNSKDSRNVLDIYANAHVDINGGSYTSTGANANAIWLSSADSSLTIDNATLKTSGNKSHALNAQYGSADATSVKMFTDGEASYGFYTTKTSSGTGLIIETTGKTGVGAFSTLGGYLTLKDSSITTRGVSAHGVAVNPSSVLKINNSTVTTNGDSAAAIYTSLGKMVAKDSTFTSAGDAVGMWALGSDAQALNDVSFDNTKLISTSQETIKVTGSTLKMVATNGSVLEGKGGKLLNAIVNPKDTTKFSEVNLEARGNTTLKGDIYADADSYASVKLFESSTLTGAVENADIEVDDSSQWQMTGTSMVQNLINAGTVAFNSGVVDDVLTVKGDYESNNGTLIFNTALNGDDSATNKLIVEGNTSGTTNVVVNNAGGTGAQTVDGIELIQVNGTSDGEFVQKGRIVAGAYEYELGRGDGSNAGNWYLMNWRMPDDPNNNQPDDNGNNTDKPVKPSRAVVRPEAGGYIANSAAAATLFNLSLFDRLGNRSLSDVNDESQSSLWLRQVAGHNRTYMGNSLDAKSNRYVVQLGGDLLQATVGEGLLHIGPMLGYGRQSTNIRSTVTNYKTESSISGYSVGAYASWFANQSSDTGFWLDSWLQYNWFDSSVSGEGLWTEKYRTEGVSASLEGGYAWKALERQGNNQRTYGFYIQPHAQIIFNGLKTVKMVEQNGTQVVTNENRNWLSRVGVRSWVEESKLAGESNLKPYVEVNWLHNSDPYDVNLNYVKVQQDSGSNRVELKTGIEGKISNNFQLNGSIAVQKGRDHYQDASVMLGAKYTF